MTKKINPVHPGEILQEEFMLPLGLSMNRLALDLRVPVTRDHDVVWFEIAMNDAGGVSFGQSFGGVLQVSKQLS